MSAPDVVLLNGNTEPRVRNSEGLLVLPCGCAHGDTHWHQMCAAHHAAWKALHDAAHARRMEQRRAEGI